MKRLLLVIISLVSITSVKAQTINFSLENSNIRYVDGNYWYYTDVFISTAAGLDDFKLGTTLVYFDYNTTAFGESVVNKSDEANDSFDMIASDGSILNEKEKDFGFGALYADFVLNNNTSSRVAASFQQNYAAGVFTGNNVTSTPALLFTVRFKYAANMESVAPGVSLSGNSVTSGEDQTYTACGPFTAAPLTAEDCTGANAGTQILGATEDSSNAADTTAPVITLKGDNPLIITQGSAYTDPGAESDDGDDARIAVGGAMVDINTVGDYIVTYNLTDHANNVAVEVTRTVTVEATLSTDAFTNELEVAVYPNPVVDTLYINADFDSASLYDLNGALVAKTTSSELNVSDLAGGVYLLEVISENGQATVKVIKK